MECSSFSHRKYSSCVWETTNLPHLFKTTRCSELSRITTYSQLKLPISETYHNLYLSRFNHLLQEYAVSCDSLGRLREDAASSIINTIIAPLLSMMIKIYHRVPSINMP